MERKLVLLDSFDLEADAQLVKAKLESEGIPAYIWEENRNYANPGHMLSSTGIKVQVYEDTWELAMEVYGEIRSYAADDNGNLISCPNCKAQKSVVYYGRKGIFFKLFPFFEERKYRCLNCNMITK